VLLEVNASGEASKSGFSPTDVPGLTPALTTLRHVRVGGLMTMPPSSADPEHSRPYFSHLADLAVANGLSRLSMGTSQDWRVAVEEGATIVRLGHALFV